MRHFSLRHGALAPCRLRTRGVKGDNIPMLFEGSCLEKRSLQSKDGGDVSVARMRRFLVRKRESIKMAK